MHVLYNEIFVPINLSSHVLLFLPYNTLRSGNQSYSREEKWKGCSLKEIMLHFFLLFCASLLSVPIFTSFIHSFIQMIFL